MDVESDSYISVSGNRIDPHVAQVLSADVVRRLNMLPIKMEDGQLLVAVISPLDLPGLDEVRLLTGLKVKPVIVTQRELSHAINEQFSIRQTGYRRYVVSGPENV